MASYFNPEEIAHYWRTTAATAKALGDDEAKCQIDPPATEDAVRAVEQELGAPIPASFRRVLLTFSRSVELCWFLPEEFELPDEFEEIFCGQISWNLDDILAVEEDRRSWIRNVFPDPHDPFDRLWHNAFSVLNVEGDQIAIDLIDRPDAVIFLTHDGEEEHGLRLAPTFEEFLSRWSKLGCVGGEASQWLPFYDKEAEVLDPDGPAAQRFREALGLDFAAAPQRKPH